MTAASSERRAQGPRHSRGESAQARVFGCRSAACVMRRTSRTRKLNGIGIDAQTLGIAAVGEGGQVYLQPGPPVRRRSALPTRACAAVVVLGTGQAHGDPERQPIRSPTKQLRPAASIRASLYSQASEPHFRRSSSAPRGRRHKPAVRHCWPGPSFRCRGLRFRRVRPLARAQTVGSSSIGPGRNHISF